MIARIKLFISIFLLVSFQGLFAEEAEKELEIDKNPENDKNFKIEKEVELYIKGEYNRGNYNNGEVQLLGNISLIDLLNFRIGFSYLQNADSPEFNFLFKAGVAPFKHPYAEPLSFSLAYILNTIVEWDITTHSILPTISYKTDRYGAEIGMSLRFTSFFGEEPIFESILSFYVYWNFIKTNMLLIGVGCGTFDDFNARNMGAIWLDLSGDIRINENFTIVNELVWMQSGMDGFTTNFYGISYKGGVKFSW